jgi:branched-chain amino acid transport system permease protein
MMGEEILEFLIIGFVLGGIYALFAVGIALIFGVLDVINVAHGEFFTLGGYTAFVTIVALKLPPVASLPLALAVTFLLGLAVYPGLIRPLQTRLGRRASGPLFLVLTLGLSAVMQNTMLAVAGGEYLAVPPLVRGGVDLSFTFVSNQRVLILVMAVTALLALFLFLRWHRQGTAIRAVMQNPDAAQAVGIPLPVIFTLTIGLGCGLAGLGGALIAPLFNVYPAVGFSLTLKAFAITILGGMGNVLGALIASFIISNVEALSVLVMPSEWTNAIAFGLMILVLLVRPQGLLGRQRP